ncbi:hypothetical protein TOPH_05375, partial [Tolypocladium ophioglossoides CBS 100239]
MHLQTPVLNLGPQCCFIASPEARTRFGAHSTLVGCMTSPGGLSMLRLEQPHPRGRSESYHVST